LSPVCDMEGKRQSQTCILIFGVSITLTSNKCLWPCLFVLNEGCLAARALLGTRRSKANPTALSSLAGFASLGLGHPWDVRSRKKHLVLAHNCCSAAWAFFCLAHTMAAEDMPTTQHNWHWVGPGRHCGCPHGCAIVQAPKPKHCRKGFIANLARESKFDLLKHL
jgi:hypothetical protein